MRKECGKSQAALALATAASWFWQPCCLDRILGNVGETRTLGLLVMVMSLAFQRLGVQQVQGCIAVKLGCVESQGVKQWALGAGSHGAACNI